MSLTHNQHLTNQWRHSVRRHLAQPGVVLLRTDPSSVQHIHQLEPIDHVPLYYGMMDGMGWGGGEQPERSRSPSSDKAPTFT